MTVVKMVDYLVVVMVDYLVALKVVRWVVKTVEQKGPL